MEVVASAAAGDLVSRFISFLMNKYYDHASLDDKVERVWRLLLRVRAVVDEADGRYITNSGMLIQLKTLAETMYQGYHLLDTFKYWQVTNDAKKQVSESSSLTLARPLKFYRTTVASTRKINAFSHELQSALENLETVIANMAEFVLFLGGCDRMSRKPFDAYLYLDNFMLGRHTERQQVINILLQENPLGTPIVLPIIGGHRVGKKTLIAHICDNERVRSSFSSILHLNQDNFLRVDNQELKFNKTLVIVLLHSDVSDTKWAKFYSSLACMGRGSKVVIVSRLKPLARFGTVKPLYLSRLSDQGFSYLFKTLAFGSANPEDHLRLLSIVKEFITEMEGSLIGAHIFADVLQKNVDLHFWLYVLKMCRRMVQRNFALYGEHPDVLFARNHPVDLSNAVFSPVTPLHVSSNAPKIELPTVTFGDLLVDPTIRPKGEFNLVTWQSKIPPYTTFVHYVPARADDIPERSSQRKKLRRHFV